MCNENHHDDELIDLGAASEEIKGIGMRVNDTLGGQVIPAGIADD